MVERNPKEHDVNENFPELSVARACDEYTDSVKTTLGLINDSLTASLSRNFQSLEELFEKIAARTKFLEQNPNFLSHLSYSCTKINSDPLREFDEIRITIKENVRRFLEKIEETECTHSKLFELVLQNAHENKLALVPCRTPKLAVLLPEFDKITLLPHHDFQIDILPAEPPSIELPLDIIPDVERRKPVEDLHKRLIQQLEASDSLEGFIKHMSRKPDKKFAFKRKAEFTTQINLKKKYEGSLWFFPANNATNNGKRKVGSKSSVRSDKSTKTIKSTPRVQPKSPNSISSCRCDLTVKSSTPPLLTNQEKSSKYQMQMGRTKLKCYDLLDDIAGRDVEPIKSEYPRKDNIFEKRAAKEKKTNPKPLLEKILGANEKVWRKLVYPVGSHLKPPPEIKKRQSAEVQGLMDYLTSPQQRCHRQNLIVMPVRVIYDNFPTRDQNSEKKEQSPIVFDREKGILGRSSPLPGPGFITNFSMASPSQSPRPPIDLQSMSRQTSPRISSPPPKKPEILISPPIQSPHSAVSTPKKHEATAKFSPLPLQRKKLMLEHLKSLKVRNDTIQKNIQKAIDVIETKMIDILSSPTNSTSTEAFNEMEQEITKVLNMINDEEKQDLEKKMGKFETAEKDENHQKIKPKTKRGQVTIRKEVVSGIPEKRPLSVEVTPKNDKLDPKTDKTALAPPPPPRTEKRFYFEEIVEKIPSPPILIPKVDKTSPVPFNSKPPPSPTFQKSDKKLHIVEESKVSEKKKAANIEEGERLLGQVDNVIKKIDDIYTKFYKENKPKVGKKENFKNVMEFFDGLKKIVEVPPPIELHYKRYEDVSNKFQEAKSYDQSTVYYDMKIIRPEINDIHEKGDYLLPKMINLDKRHERALKIFYAVFFSSILVALNFDYSC